MKTVKTHIGGKDTATIICDQCGRSKEIDVSRINNAYVPRRVTCPCGAVFEVLFEKRRYFRKEVQLLGKCWKTEASIPQAISVMTLSRTSIGFQVLPEHLKRLDEDQEINTGDLLHVEFMLDTDPKGVIRAKVIVRSITEDAIGAEFFNLDVHTEKQLGFYVMP